MKSDIKFRDCRFGGAEGMTRPKTLKYCATCKYYEVYTCACCNRDSEHVAGFVNMTGTCETWEEITEKDGVNDE